MNPINDQNQQNSKQNKNLTPVLVAAGIFVFVILISLLGIYLLTRQKTPTGQRPVEITEVGAGRVNGPEVSIKKQGDTYIVDAQMPILIQTNDDGINFKNDTNMTVGVFVPVLQDGGNLKILPGSVEGFSLRSLRRDSTVCVGNDKCNQFEFLGSVYPALFKGSIEIVSANTVTNTPAATPTPDIFISTESSDNKLIFSETQPGQTSSQRVVITNIGLTTTTIERVGFDQDSSTNPFSVVAQDGCVTSSSFPLTLTSGQSVCLNIVFAPGVNSDSRKILQVVWNGVYNIELIGSIAIVATSPITTVTIPVEQSPSCNISNRYVNGQDASGVTINIVGSGSPGPEWRITRSLPFRVVKTGLLENGTINTDFLAEWGVRYSLQIKNGSSSWYTEPSCQFFYDNPNTTITQ